MQEGGVTVPLLSGNGTSSSGPSQGAPTAVKGGSSFTAQGVSLASRGGASTSSAQGISLPSRGGMSASAFQAASNTPRGGVTTSAFQGAVNPPRQRFHVELKEGETNVVSWKKLLKDAQKHLTPIVSDAPAGANPALEARFAPDRAGSVHTNGGAVQEALPPPPNRFSSVIEKIERLYKGGDSEEEEGDASPDDSQYDTEDDFIDDSELNEYFSVEKSKTKHTGFFVNRGKLEKINEAPASPPAHVPRKRKRRDMKTIAAEKIVEESAKKRVNTGLRLKDAARKSIVFHAADRVAGTLEYRGSDQSSVPKLKKRLKPIHDGRDKSADQVPTVTVENVNREVLKVPKVEDTKKEMNAKAPMTIVELSDDDNDPVEVSRQAPESERKIVDYPKRQVPRQHETGQGVVDERNQTRPVKASTDDRQARDSAREIRSPVVVAKVKKDQPLNREYETWEREGTGRTPALVASSPGPKEVSPGKRAGWPKGTVLERAIHDLEKGVAESFPFRGDKEDKLKAIEIAEAQGGKSKRMPRDVKQKLAKVARLAARQGKIPDELIDRLMTILGHVMRLRTLKRNLKSMVELGVTAKLEKDVRLLSMKREVTELVKNRVSHQAIDAEQREGSSDDFQTASGSGDRGAVNGRYKWDQATEDRICDLYDQYVEGMDEHKGPQIRKLYLELAELWPEGWMDNHGIKNAVFRAKERQRKQNKLKMGEEKRRRKEALMSEKKNGDSAVERHTATSSAPTNVAPLKALPSSKEKLTIISSSKQRVHESSRRVDEDNRRVGDEVSNRNVEEIRRLVVEEKRRGLEQRLDDRPSKRIDDPGMNRENGSHSSLSKEKQKIRMEDGIKVRRSEDLLNVKRKLPRKSYEGKIIEHSARKRPKKEISDSHGIESGRSSNHTLLNSPLQKLKRKKLRPTSEAKPYPSLRISPSPVNVASKGERYHNSSYPSANRPSGIPTGRSGDSDRIREDRPRENREDRVRELSDRARDVARWPSEAARLLKE